MVNLSLTICVYRIIESDKENLLLFLTLTCYPHDLSLQSNILQLNKFQVVMYDWLVSYIRLIYWYKLVIVTIINDH